MNNISEWIHRISTGRVTLLMLVIFLLFGALVLPAQSALAEETSGGAGSPDTSFIYSAADLYQMAESYGEAGRAAYIRARFTFDLVFPLVYTAFLVTAISWLSRRGFPAGSRWQLANLAPILGAIFDYLENIAAALVMSRYPALTPVVDALAPVFTLVKWIFVGGSFALLLIGLAAAIFRWFKHGSGKTT
jgi:hypothetical protein